MSGVDHDVFLAEAVKARVQLDLFEHAADAVPGVTVGDSLVEVLDQAEKDTLLEVDLLMPDLELLAPLDLNSPSSAFGNTRRGDVVTRSDASA